MKRIWLQIKLGILSAVGIVLLITPINTSFAESNAFSKLNKKVLSQVLSLKYETELQIKTELTPQFDKIFGRDNQWIELTGQFDEESFLRDEGLLADSENAHDLPGITIKSDAAPLQLKGGPQDFKMYLKYVDISVFSRKEPSEEQLRKAGCLRGKPLSPQLDLRERRNGNPGVAP